MMFRLSIRFICFDPRSREGATLSADGWGEDGEVSIRAPVRERRRDRYSSGDRG